MFWKWVFQLCGHHKSHFPSCPQRAPNRCCTRKQHHQSHYGDLRKKGQHPPEANVLLSPHLDVEGNKGVGMQWEQQGFDQQWLMFSVKRCNYPGRSRVSRLVSHMSSIAACPLPFSVIAVWFVLEKHIFHCHIARRIGIWWQLAIIYSTHNCRNGNIYSSVTVLRDLAPDDNNHTPLVEGKHIFHCHSARWLSTCW